MPAGAVGVRLCDLATTGVLLAPVDELTTGVETLVAQFNGAESFDSTTMACTADAGPSYAMVVRYPDGNVVTVTSMMAGCHTVGGRLGGQELLATFTTQLAEQRRASPPQPVPHTPCVGPQGSWMPVDPGELTAITGCSGHGPDARALGTATAQQWAVLQADLVAHARPASYPAATTEPVRFDAVDRFGQPVQLDRIDDSVVINSAGAGVRGAAPLVWEPSADSRAILDALGS